MEISILAKEANRLRLQIAVAESDYEQDFNTELKKASKLLTVPGFRKGHVPTQMAKKMIGDSVKGKVVNEIVSNKIEEVIEEQGLHQLMSPLPADENDEQFALPNPTFTFDIALIPTEEFNFDVQKENFTGYEAEVTDKEVEEALSSLLQNARSMQEVDTIDEEAMLHGHLSELQGETQKEDGIKRTDTILALRSLKDEEEKKKFIGHQKGDVVIFNPYKACDGSAVELRYLLGLDKEVDIEQYKEVEFSLQVTKISSMVDAELDQEFYDRAFGEGVVNTEEEAKAKIKDQLEQRNKNISDVLLAINFFKVVDEKYTSQLNLADELILATHEFTTETKITEPKERKEIISGLKIELYTREWAKKLEIATTKEEIINFAKEEIRQQFASFGWTANVPEDLIEQSALKRINEGGKAYIHNIELNVLRNSIIQKVKPELNITTEVVTFEELTKKLENSHSHPEKSEETSNEA